jgi:predicted nucleic acid-binding protein
VNKTYVLDASAMVILIENRSGATRVGQLVREADRLNVPLMASVVNWAEVFYLSWTRSGEETARKALNYLSLLPIKILPVDSAQALKAAELRALHHVPYVDCLAAALSSIHQATLVTSDADFEKLGRHFPILWLKRT